MLVTSGISDIGYETAEALTAAGAQVVIAARSPERGAEAIARIRKITVPAAASEATAASRLWTVTEQLTGARYR